MTTQTFMGITPKLSEKRAELIWALSQQPYSDSEIGLIFGISKQRVQVIRNQMPDGWVSPWIKIK
jgi:DNA-directed RNA polymerase sigma subunit (sigma70/sigma32)